MPRTAPEDREIKQLGKLLADWRKAAKLTQDQAAKELGVNRYRLSYVERGGGLPTDEEVALMIERYKRPADDLRTVQAQITACETASSMWWDEFSPYMTRSLQTLVFCETAATAINSATAVIIPGLLQTRDYATALFADEIVERGSLTMNALLEVRVGRGREVFARTEPPVKVHSIFSEAALHAVVGDRKVMREQLRHIAQLAKRAQVTVQVLGFNCGAVAQLTGAYTVYEYGDGRPDSMHADALDQIVISDLQSEVAKAKDRFRKLSDVSLSPGDSLKLIEQIGKGL